MTRLIVTRGLPGSGKTTWAREWVARDPAGRARVNRDSLRDMAHDGEYLAASGPAPGTERVILALRDATISALLERGVDVVCDDTNLPSRTVRDLRRLAVRAGADFEVRDLTDVPVETCLARDAARERSVGEAVILRLWQKYVRGRRYPLTLPDEPIDPTVVVVYVPRPDVPSAVLVDIDGTVALMAARSPFDEARVGEDRPNQPVIDAVRAVAAAGHKVIFCSGRTDGCREATEAWLREHVGVPHEGLYMRRAGDTRKDSIVKAELFDRHIRDAYRVVGVFDDRQQVVDMWRAMGLTVFQVAPGDF